MLPAIVAKELQTAVKQYLQTTFPVTSGYFRRGESNAFIDSLVNDPGALFKGPYLTIDLPFRIGQADKPLPFSSFDLPFTPYVHQLRAFERLTGANPLSTLIATGTGSGKTECFLYPLLDHCARQPGGGIKAIVIYPMNALATDQAERFAKQIKERGLSGKVSVGLFTGDSDSSAYASMGDDHVITSKNVLRSSPPDILLTNYKMLDFLLLRPKDRPLWEKNTPGMLRFLVVDELHTFDGAQGTDLGCLVRRLRDRLDTGDDLACVGTSATLGGEESAELMLDYAKQVFGIKELSTDALIREDRLTAAEFLSEFSVANFDWPIDESRRGMDPEGGGAAGRHLERLSEIWLGKPVVGLASADEAVRCAARVKLGEWLMKHAAVHDLVQRAADSTTFAQVSAAWQRRTGVDAGQAEVMITTLCALLSEARAWKTGLRPEEPNTEAMVPLLRVRLQLWLRELRRMVASVAASPRLQFSDDLSSLDKPLHLPMVHCRECHAAGWLTVKPDQSTKVSPRLESIYPAFFGGHADVCLLFAPNDRVTETKGTDCEICCTCGSLTAKSDGETCAQCGSKQSLPVWRPDMRSASGGIVRSDRKCPYCFSPQGLSIVGARAATMSSAVLDRLYESQYNDDRKLIAFSDSVQDAAHRAGFFGARTYRNIVRWSMVDYLHSQGTATLERAAREFPRFCRDQCGDVREFISRFIAPDMQWISEWDALLRGQKTGFARLESQVKDRLEWEFIVELGLRSRIGRTLERGLAAALEVERDRVDEATDRLARELSEHLESLRHVDSAFVRQYVTGILWKLRTKGAFFHPFVESYVQNGGSTYLMSRQAHMPGYGKASWPPTFITMKKVSREFDQFTASRGSWFRHWFNKTLGASSPLASSEFVQAASITLRVLEAVGLLSSREVRGNDVWGLEPSSWAVSAEVNALACNACGQRVEAPVASYHLFDQLACLRPTCIGSYTRAKDQTSLYPRTHGLGKPTRVIAQEHTGLLDPETRDRVEKSFKRKEPRPWDVNLLSATPTLEMGIDIGDLSTVLLCSVPPAQANYLQRIGRAGRKDGNSLSVTVANGRPHDLYFYDEPREMLAGKIDPPGVFLQATAVLERQLVAFCFDRWNLSGIDSSEIPPFLGNVLDAVDSGATTTFPHNLLDFVRKNSADLFESFLKLFSGLGEESREHLRAFLYGTDSTPGIEWRLTNRLHATAQERKSLRQRAAKLKRRKDELEGMPEDDSVRDERAGVENERDALLRLIRTKINRKQTLNFLTDEGILPNYAFPEEGVTLNSIIYRQRARDDEGDSESGPEKLTFELRRPAAAALRELPPDTAFYAVGRKLTIDQVDLDVSPVETWRLCDACHFSARETGSEHDHDSTCPRCGSPGWTDTGQRAEMVRLKQVFTIESDRKTRIGDDSDQREPDIFNSQVLVDIGSELPERAYRIVSDDTPFGFEFRPRVTFREINFGRIGEQGSQFHVAGELSARGGFKLCRDCGTVRRHRSKSVWHKDHAYSCQFRRRNQPPEESDFHNALYLYRELESEAVRILIPITTMSPDDGRIRSLISALHLGLKSYFRGRVDHLQITMLRTPDSKNVHRNYLVVYDTVPGGTGYLKEIMHSPDRLFKALRMAADTLESCRCNNDPEKDGCYRCIYAYRESRFLASVSRSQALSVLQRILGHCDSVESVKQLGDIEINSLLESELEERFMPALESFRGFHLQRERVNYKPGWFITISDEQESEWRLEPQVDLGPAEGVKRKSRADFVLWPVKQSSAVLPVAVFLDGYEYHKDSIDKDVLKRQSILASGRFRIWTLTWKDVALNEATKECTDRLSGADFVDDSLFSALGVRANWQPIDKLRGVRSLSPIELLVAYLRNPTEGENEQSIFEGAALSVSLGWVSAARNNPRAQDQGTRDEAEQLIPRAAAEVVADGDMGKFGGVLRTLGHSGIQFRSAAFVPAEPSLATILERSVTVLALDDEGVPEKDEFRRFWAAANLLQFLPSRLFLSSSVVVTHPDYPTARVVPQPSVDTGEWAEIQELTLCDPESIERLRLAQVTFPEVGYEIRRDSEVVAQIELAWPDQKIAFLLEEEDSTYAEVEQQGWTVFDAIDDKLIERVNKREMQ